MKNYLISRVEVRKWLNARLKPEKEFLLKCRKRYARFKTVNNEEDMILQKTIVISLDALSESFDETFPKEEL